MRCFNAQGNSCLDFFASCTASYERDLFMPCIQYVRVLHVYTHCSTDNDDGKTLLGTLDYAWLFSYAVAMFFR